jgi:hypothetical protein
VKEIIQHAEIGKSQAQRFDMALGMFPQRAVAGRLEAAGTAKTATSCGLFQRGQHGEMLKSPPQSGPLYQYCMETRALAADPENKWLQKTGFSVTVILRNECVLL